MPPPWLWSMRLSGSHYLADCRSARALSSQRWLLQRKKDRGNNSYVSSQPGAPGAGGAAAIHSSLPMVPLSSVCKCLAVPSGSMEQGGVEGPFQPIPWLSGRAVPFLTSATASGYVMCVLQRPAWSASNGARRTTWVWCTRRTTTASATRSTPSTSSSSPTAPSSSGVRPTDMEVRRTLRRPPFAHSKTGSATRLPSC